jgi:hypothetical protein
MRTDERAWIPQQLELSVDNHLHRSAGAPIRVRIRPLWRPSIRPLYPSVDPFGVPGMYYVLCCFYLFGILPKAPQLA